MLQTTLATACDFEGKGLHSGAPCRISVRPAPAGTGIVFVRTDLGVEIPATAAHVVSTRRSTTLGSGSARIGTVEHLLAALTGLGIDNARIETPSREIPILDGSAAPFVQAISAAGTVQQDAPRLWLRPSREIEVTDPRSGAYIRVTPADAPSLEVTVDYGSRVLGVQTVSLGPATDFASQIAPCRTFCFLHEVMPQLLLGLARGGDATNAIIIAERPVGPVRLKALARIFGQPSLHVTPEGYLSNLALRFPDECGRHKLLDLLGDLRLAGGFLQARVTAYKPGHALNTSLSRQLFNKL